MQQIGDVSFILRALVARLQLVMRFVGIFSRCIPEAGVETMNSEAYTTLINECDQALREANSKKAIFLIRSLALTKIPREFRLRLAELCRRANIIQTGMKILAPIVRADRPAAADKATDQESAEYASLLEMIGAVPEAMKLLTAVDKRKAPRAILYQAFCSVSQWEYEAASRLFVNYLETDLLPYPRLIGSVNYAAALIAVPATVDQGLELLAKNIELAQQNSYNRLLGNCYELRAQARISRGQFALATSDLEKAMNLVGVEKIFEQLFIKKWCAVLAAVKNNDVTPIRHFQKEAEASSHWESVRDSDLQSLLIHFEQGRFEHLFIGTPFPKYRLRITERLHREAPNGIYSHGSKGDPTLDLSTGQFESTQILNPGKKSHQLLEFGLRDFYRPMRIGALFGALFASEYFDIFTSPGRVHKVIQRARSTFADHNLPLTIIEQRSGYWLQKTGPLEILIPIQRPTVSTNEVYFQRLRNAMAGNEEFTAQEAKELLKVSNTSFWRFSRWGVESGIIESFGKGAATRYRFCAGSSDRSPILRQIQK